MHRLLLIPATAILSFAAVTGCSAQATSETSPSAAAESESGNSTAPASEQSLAFVTSAGDVTIALDPNAPQTVESMTTLATSGYFDGTSCHRLTTQGIFVLQCGDPEGTGRGGPGYTIADENLPTQAGGIYPAGTVAMANAGPDTNGSQFFLVYEDSPLPPSYTVWGTLSSGVDTVRAVAANGTVSGAPDGAPKTPVVIESVTVSGR
jgi:peptidyl-prolyl cis-trans isomerase B (cyclophilin B)